ncbi:hypothetical protein SBA5_80033 [Candidatus Sulfotelmatomonas gaucii]|uniref:Uncharacterized protein n=1 Tax=Candidatus Sulfuritelmatomonas gaucii TaxID=2043161 RepID=A0A2N9M5A5_9BACT|nr:hypothetical protein SBA5_80033 [Candidatus Sulfotelmatomonas gaucii]
MHKGGEKWQGAAASRTGEGAVPVASTYDRRRFVGLVGGVSRSGGGLAGGGFLAAGPPARVAARAGVHLDRNGGGGAGRGGVRLLDRRGDGQANGAGVCGRLHH